MKVLTVEESCKVVGVSRKSFLTYVKQGIIKSHTSSQSRNGPVRHMWLYSDVINGKKELAKYRNQQKEMSFKRAEWARKSRQIKAEAMQDLFNVWLHSFVKIARG